MGGFHDVAGSSVSAEWPTPQWLVDDLADEFTSSGVFDLDPCATVENAKAAVFYTMTEDGLSMPWHGRVWLNPPYGRTDSCGRPIGAWMQKAVTEVSSGNAELVVALVPARPGTQWWRDATEQASLVRIWPRRIVFVNNQPAPFDSGVLVFGKLARRHSDVAHTCLMCNRVFWARRRARTCSDACRMALSRSHRADVRVRFG